MATFSAQFMVLFKYRNIPLEQKDFDSEEFQISILQQYPELKKERYPKRTSTKKEQNGNTGQREVFFKQRNETILILTPLKDASKYLEQYFDGIDEFTYPKELISSGFIEGDSSDDTYQVLCNLIKERNLRSFYNRITVVQKSLQDTEVSTESRHDYHKQLRLH